MRNNRQDPTGDEIQHERDLIATAREQASQARARAAVAWSPGHAGPLSADSSDGFTGDSMKPLSDLLPGYELQREIHRGGQGVVYQALQKSTRRRVAIKVMKEGPFAGTDDKARFDREVRILGQLNHPSIVAIHDSGTAAGCFYFVMDYIAGPPLDACMRDGERKLEETLRLFAKICDAVNAAHLRGIIHRDLKPSNILIDADAQPHILDFGLAKVEEGSSAPGGTIIPTMTRTGQFVGSLPWASPEQVAGVAGGIDIRSDVYSLGVVLYQMLSGTFPYDVRGNMQDVVQRILHAEPIRLSAAIAQSSGLGRLPGGRRSRALHRLFGAKHNDRIDDEVETIVLKCLSKQREHRYQNAGELARDIRHYLAGEPIEARRHSLGYLLYKYVQQHQLHFAFACTLLAVLVAGLIVSLTFWRQALTAQTGLERALQLAEQREADIRQVADAQAKMLSNVDPLIMGARLREDIFAEARAALQRSGAGAEQLAGRLEQLESQLAGINFTNLGVRSIDRNVLAPALAGIERDFADQPLVQAALWESIASVYVELGLYDEALPAAERALETRRRLFGDDHPDTLESLSSMGWLLYARGEPDEADLYIREALETRRLVLGDDHPETLTSMAGLLAGQREYSEAEPYFREALEKRRRVLGDDHPDTLESISCLGVMLWKLDKLSEAEPYFHEALDGRRRVLGDDHRATLLSISNMGLLLTSQGRLAEAETYYREALKGFRRVLGDDHSTTLYRMRNLGNVLRYQGRQSEAEEVLAEALRRAREARWEGRLIWAFLWPHAQTLVALERFEQAEAELVELQEIIAVLPEPPNARSPLTPLVGLYDAWHAAEPDQGYDAKAAELRAKLPAADRAASLIKSGKRLLGYGRYVEAEAVLSECLQIRQEILAEGHWLIFNAMSFLGEALAGQAKFAEAEPRLVEGYEKMTPPPHIANRKQQALERIIKLYDAWHAAEPNQGYDAKAAEWRARLAEQQAK